MHSYCRIKQTARIFPESGAALNDRGAAERRSNGYKRDVILCESE